MRLWIFASIVALIACFIGYYRLRPLAAKVRINNAVFFVEIAASEPQKQKGLGNRSNLASDHGMLFPYDHKEQYNFWMRGMRFPLDFIWIDGDRVADITENVPPPIANSAPVIVKPNVPVNKVLEVNAGTIQRNGIRIGDAVEFLDR